MRYVVWRREEAIGRKSIASGPGAYWRWRLERLAEEFRRGEGDPAVYVSHIVTPDHEDEWHLVEIPD